MDNALKIEELVERLDNLRRRHLRDYAYSSKLNLRQLEALIYLSKCNRYSDTPLALADYLGLTKGTVSQTVISLEDKGLVEKQADLNDKRMVHLKLTAKGNKLVERCLKNTPLSTGVAFSSEPQDTERLAQQLEELLSQIQKRNDYTTFGVCKTCSHFRVHGLGARHQCGLTLEPLLDKESLKICKEHNSPD